MKCLQDMRTSLPRSVWVWRVGTLGCGGRVAASPYLVSGHFLIEHRRKSTPSVLPAGSNTSPFFCFRRERNQSTWDLSILLHTLPAQGKPWVGIGTSARNELRVAIAKSETPEPCPFVVFFLESSTESTPPQRPTHESLDFEAISRGLSLKRSSAITVNVGDLITSCGKRNR